MKKQAQQNIQLHLQQLHNELLKSLRDANRKHRHPTVQTLIQSELNDVENALFKLEDGQYGICEISGELIPFEQLKSIPTLRNKHETEKFKEYMRIGLY